MTFTSEYLQRRVSNFPFFHIIIGNGNHNMESEYLMKCCEIIIREKKCKSYKGRRRMRAWIRFKRKGACGCKCNANGMICKICQSMEELNRILN